MYNIPPAAIKSFYVSGISHDLIETCGYAKSRIWFLCYFFLCMAFTYNIAQCMGDVKKFKKERKKFK